VLGLKVEGPARSRPRSGARRESPACCPSPHPVRPGRRSPRAPGRL